MSGRIPFFKNKNKSWIERSELESQVLFLRCHWFRLPWVCIDLRSDRTGCSLPRRL